MARDGFKVMDSDMHIWEPPDLWQRYIDPAFADRAPIGLSRCFRDLGIQVDGKVLPTQTVSPAFPAAMEEILRSKYAEPGKRDFDAASQVWAMDQEGLDVAVLFPTRGLFVLGIDGLDPELGAAIARAYNDWLHDFCQEAPDRMFGAAMISPHDVRSAAQEARRAVRELGFKSVFLRPNFFNGRAWSDPSYDPLWAECESLGVPVGFHEGGGVYQPQPALQQFTTTFSIFNTLSFPLANMVTCADLIFGGVLERFPKLQVAFLEGNCSWVPWLLWRMGEYMELVGKRECPNLALEPLEYFRRQCYTSIECDEITASHLPEHGLEDNVVYSTDYPHLEPDFPHTVEIFLRLPFPDEIKRKYLWDNCARLYGFEPSNTEQALQSASLR